MFIAADLFSLMWFKKTWLETLFKGDNLKALIKTSTCENFVLYFSENIQKIAAFAMFFLVFSDQTIAWKWFWLPPMIRNTPVTR